MEPRIQQRTKVCHEGRLYFLTGAIEPGRRCNYATEICDPFDELPGMSGLDGKEWGGLTKEDFVIGYVCSHPYRHSSRGSGDAR